MEGGKEGWRISIGESPNFSVHMHTWQTSPCDLSLVLESMKCRTFW